MYVKMSIDCLMRTLLTKLPYCLCQLASNALNNIEGSSVRSETSKNIIANLKLYDYYPSLNDFAMKLEGVALLIACGDIVVIFLLQKIG